MEESLAEITKEWLRLVKAHHELGAIRISDKDRIDHLPLLIDEMAKRIDKGSEITTEPAKSAAVAHGKQRAMQGYNIPLVVIEMRLLQHVLRPCFSTISFAWTLAR